ncbi:MAG: sterol desaturase family protein [Acidimicrobiia bacterium]|nr:sterol desaturase family protein [Acidimicrobiia bacterium]
MTAVVVLFVILAPFEKLYPRQKGQKWRRPLAANDISFALMNPLLSVVGGIAFIGIGALSLFWLPGLAFRPLVAMIPGWALPIVAFALFDFLGYWTHRWAHEVPFLWRFHAVHHSPEHMDWVSGFRIHPFDGVLIGPAVLFLLAAGFDAELTGVLAIVQIVLGLFFHANVRVRWRRLDKFLANPEFHHWHHANEADSIGHNYAPGLPLWDLAFGTFFMPNHKTGRRPQHYGIDEYLPRNMVGQLSYPLRGSRQYVSLWRHPIKATKLGYRGVRKLLGDVWATTRRPTHSVRRETVPGSFSTNSSLFDKTPADA